MSKPIYTEKDARKYRKALETMARKVQVVITRLDRISITTLDENTGRAIAIACNKLELSLKPRGG